MTALAPSETVGFVLQMAGLGALWGSAFALYRRRSDDQADTWLPSAVGGLVGAGAGV